MIDNRIRTVLVTGASSGIGQAFCRLLARANSDLILVARRKLRLLDFQKELDGHGVSIQLVVADLSTIKGIAQVLDVIRQRAPIDLLINNAGSGAFGSFTDSSPARQIAITRVQIDATLALTRGVLPFMRTQSFGRIINVSSIGAFISMKRTAVYGASKAFLNSFSRSLNEEEGENGIKVQCLCPGMTKTEIHDSVEFSDFDKTRISEDFWMTPEAVAEFSLAELESDRLFVIPGKKNEAIVSNGLAEMKLLLQK